MDNKPGKRCGKDLYHAYGCDLLHIKKPDTEKRRHIQEQGYHEDGPAQTEQSGKEPSAEAQE
jgi:hypothetical protein